MNTYYLMKYISNHLHTYVYQYNSEGKRKNQACERPDFNDIFIANPELEHLLLNHTSKELPILCSNQSLITFSIISDPDSLFIIGPVMLDATSCFKTSLPQISFDPNWISAVPPCNLFTLLQDILLLHNLHNQTEINSNDIIVFNCIDPKTIQTVQRHFSNILFEHQEYGEMHNSYYQEIRELTSIRNGDLEQLKKSISEDVVGNYGILAKTKLRSFKNLCIVVLTLASRAAIDGGVSSEVSFSLCDGYINKVEELSTVESLLHMARNAEYQYAQMVHNIKEQKELGENKKQKNPHVNRCKDYIFAHLHEKILLTEIAEHLKLNPVYLGEVFIKCEGIPITQYIMREKISISKNLLIYSPYTYSQIAAYLGFSSQSHFGKQFKKITDSTPKQYRDVYGVKEFLQ